MTTPLEIPQRTARFLLSPETVHHGDHFDVLVVGAGIAGLSVALSLPEELSIAVVLKGQMLAETGGRLVGPAGRHDGSSEWAQGGIAAVFADDDSVELHLADTIAAGAGLCEPDAVRALVEEAPGAVRFLESHGVAFDSADGSFDLTREGGHSRRRVVHAGGDTTGEAVMLDLVRAARSRRVTLFEETLLVDLLTSGDGVVFGALLLEGTVLRQVLAPRVVLATGGFGRLFSETTSPLVNTGDGLAAAIRAGAAVADLEFVQFHPTAMQLASDPRPLASESLRGEGAVIRNAAGVSVMAGRHRLADLAPRDVVSRSMAIEMRALRTDHLFLDVSAIGPHLVERFPSLVGACRAGGIDPERDWVPIAPAVHYVMGGVRTDLWGRSTLRGLYAVGEVAQSGVHGANRLASNSLLEGIVFGRRAAIAIVEDRAIAEPVAAVSDEQAAIVRADRAWLRGAMTRGAGVLRDAAGLERLATSLEARALPVSGGIGRAEIEDANLSLIGTLLTGLALRREESRGAHARADHPEALEQWRHHQVLWREPGGAFQVADSDPPKEGSSVEIGMASLSHR